LAFVSLYRKYRSQTFGDLIGQDHVVRTLQNGITSGRIAHSYLFTGPRGTGKTSSARLLAKALNCEKGPTAEPCNVCSSCVGITNGSAMDVMEVDAASESGVEKVREVIVDTVQYAPSEGNYRIFIIDEVHDLSNKAFDALLKTIEEPPPHIIFILATTEYNKVPPTIRSRCQKFEFHRASLSDLQKRLSYVAEAEGIAIDPAAVGAIARMADGGYRDALTLLEQARLVTDGTITMEVVYDQLGMIADDQSDQLLLAIKGGEVATILNGLAELGRRGRDPRGILESLLYRVAELTQAVYQQGQNVDATAEAAAHATAMQIGAKELLQLRGRLSDAHRTIRDITLPRLWLESELIRISQLPEPGTVVHVAPAAATAAPAAQTQREERQVARTAVVEQTNRPVAATPAPTPKAGGGGKDVPKPGFRDPKWVQAFGQLAKISATMGFKLESVTKAEQAGDALTLFFTKKMDLVWVNEDARKLGAVQNVVHDVYGPNVAVELVHLAEDKPDVATAVELELKGSELYDEIKRNLRGDNDETS
jgi:DNA polymerase III subunit gamma/tau